MLPTPLIPSNIDFDRVYEPSEDTFLLLDALEQDLELIKSLNPVVCLEVGSGSGCGLVDPIRCEFASNICTRLNHQVDVMIFNPPYVLTPPEELNKHGIEAAWAGGKDGRQVLDSFMPQISDLLSTKGIFYLIAINENKPQEIIDIMTNKYGLQGERILYRKAGIEGLSVLRFRKQ